jgi:hypothetical protein
MMAPPAPKPRSATLMVRYAKWYQTVSEKSRVRATSSVSRPVETRTSAAYTPACGAGPHPPTQSAGGACVPSVIGRRGV